MTEQAPAIGQIVDYTLGEGDVGVITQHPRPGNGVCAGEVYPAMVVRVFDPSVTTANLQVFLDGSDSYWATSRTEGDGPEHWAWSGRA